jgi:hypothetical protein
VKTSSAKSKGRRLCAHVRERLLHWCPDIQPGDIAVTPSGVTGPDLYLSPAAKIKYNLAWECKNQETLNIWEALKQAEGHVAGDEKPVVAFTRNRVGKVYVALDLEDFLWLIQ